MLNRELNKYFSLLPKDIFPLPYIQAPNLPSGVSQVNWNQSEKKFSGQDQENAGTATSTEDVKKKKKERRKKSEDLSSEEKTRILKKFQKQLIDARSEIESLAESKVRLSHLQAVIETQNMTLEELRQEIRTLKSRQNQLSDKMIDQPKLTDRNMLDNNLQTFVAQIKSSVDDLGLASQTIDSEFAAI